MFRSGPPRVDRSFSRANISSGSGAEAAYEFSEVSGAVIEEGFNMNPTTAIYDLLEYGGAFDRGDDVILSKEDIKARKDTEFYSQFIDVPDEGMTENEYQRLYRDVQKKKIRDDKFSRAPDTVTQGAKNLLLSLGVGIFDPINAATGYLPGAVVKAGLLGHRASVYAKLAERSFERADVGTRAIRRVAEGAATGGVESAITDYALVNPALRARQEQEESILTSLIMGAAIGSGARVVFGSFGDIATMESRAEKKVLRDQWKERVDIVAGFVETRRVDALRATPEFQSTTKALAKAIQEQVRLTQVQGEINGRMGASYADKQVMTQSALGLFLDDRVVNLRDMDILIYEKNLQQKYKSSEINRIRRDVISDFLDEEVDANDRAHVSPERTKSQVDKLTGDIHRLNQKLVALKRKKGPPGPRKKLYQEIEAKKAEIDKITTKKDTWKKRGREDFSEKVLDENMRDRIDSEVTRRINIIKAGEKSTGNKVDPLNVERSELNKAMNGNPLGNMYKIATSEEGKRGHVVGAKEELDERGTPKAATKETADILQEAADAEINARALAEENGVEYAPDNIDETIKGIDEEQKVNEILSTCMGK